MLYLAELTPQVLAQSVHLLLGALAFTLLSTPHNHVVLLVIRDHLCKVNVLGVSCHIERLNVNFQVRLPISRDRQRRVELLHELECLVNTLEPDLPGFSAD